MPIEITMPALSPTMTEGNLAKWNIKEGDVITSGKVIAEIETDKATMEVEAVDEGIVGKILIPAGTAGVAVNQVIALLLEEGEDPVVLKDYTPKGAGSSSAPPPKAANESSAPAAAPVAAPSAKTGEKIKASPLAKRVAEQSGVNLANVSGTGPHGRIIKADVLEANTQANRVGVAAVGLGVRNEIESFDVPLSTMRGVIAKRLLESKQNIPHFYLSVDIELDGMLAARKQMNAMAEAAAGKGSEPAYKLSVNDIVIKCVAHALRDCPEANAAWGGDKIIRYNNIDISVAVAIDGGLITPIIRNADQKSFSNISNEMKDLAKRARAGKLQPHEFQGGGFSISNLGMYGIKNFNAIINPPQSCILAIGAGEERVVVKNGQMQVANVMTVTLSSDHRVVDGAVGAVFLQAFRKYCEQPLLMLA